MNQNYLRIRNISSLDTVLSYLQNINTPGNITVFWDWDDTLVNPDNNMIIEPEITKKLFDLMKEKQIFFAVITGRFYETACDDKRRNIFDMQQNILTTIHPILNRLGIDTRRYQTDAAKQTVYKIYNELNQCVGILYMGIIFSGTKGAAIKNYLRQIGISKAINEIIFIDDYEPYLYETTSSLDHVTAFRRLVPYGLRS